MAYLDDVIAATQKTKSRTKRSEGTASLISALIAQKAAQEEMQAAEARSQGASPLAGPAMRPSGRGSAAPVGGGGNESNELWNRLQKMIKDRPSIRSGSRSRDYATQVALYAKYKAGKGAQAARPGTSKHGNGRANDLKYGNDSDRQWALANAGKYGLSFPLYNPKLSRGRDESWHVELKR